MIRLALRFAALGALLFAAVHAGRAWWTPAPAVSSASVPREERLVREALALGLHRSDPVVRRRLVQNLRFLGADPGRSDEALFEEALALGLHETDLVVRRRLVQRLELAAGAAAREETPADAELEAWLRAHRERFERPARVRITQVMLSRERRGSHLERDARELLERLHREQVSPDDAVGWGDPSLLPGRIPLRAGKDLARDFGATFARSVLALPTGRWSGPVPSAFGLHLVFVHERAAARLPALAEVRDAVLDDFAAERARRRLEAAAGAP